MHEQGYMTGEAGLARRAMVTAAGGITAVGVLIAGVATGRVDVPGSDERGLVASVTAEADPSTTDPTTDTTVPEAIPGSVEYGDGADDVVAAETAQGLYDCGGVKNELWKNADGTDKPFNPDLGLIPHMNEHEDLAQSDYNFWVDVMGDDGFRYLANRAYPNAEHNDEVADLDVDGVPEEYEAFIEKQVGTVMQEDLVTANHACEKDGNYYVRPVGLKHMPAGQARITGMVIDDEYFEAFDQLVSDEDMARLIVQSVDTDGDGVNDAKHVGAKHMMCGNNETKTDVAIPPNPEDDTPDTPDTTRKPGTTVTTRGGNTSTTQGTSTTVTPTTKDPEVGYLPNGGTTSPNGGPGTPGTLGPEGTTSTTKKPNPPQTTNTTVAITSTTLGECGEACA